MYEGMSSGMKVSLAMRMFGEGCLVLWIRKNRRVKGKSTIAVFVSFFRGVMLLLCRGFGIE